MSIPTKAYPAAFDSDASLFGDPIDQVLLTLKVSIADNATSFQVNEDISTINVPTFLAFATGEIVYCGAKTDGTSTFSSVQRAGTTLLGFPGTSQPHDAPEQIRLIVVSSYIKNLKDAIVAVETELGVLPKGAHADITAAIVALDALIASKAAASGIASLNGSSKVVQDPANATATATGSKIPIADVSAHIDTWISAMSDSVPGKVEAATIAETEAGSDSGRAVTPDGLAGSNLGERILVFCLNGSTALTTSDKAAFRVPSSMAGMRLVEVAAHCGLDLSSGSPTTNPIVCTVQKAATSMLSTNISIDATEYDTGTAAAPPVIETNGGAYTVATVAEGDIINVEIASTGTGATYFEVVLVFRLP